MPPRNPKPAKGAPASAAPANTTPANAAPPQESKTRASVISFLERHHVAICLLLAVLASIRIVATHRVFMHTFDEPAHIACGMEWLDRGVYRWEAQHPPLSRVAAAIGPYLSGIRSQNTPERDYLSKYMEGLAILYSGHHYDSTLAMARLGILPFFWVACFVTYRWARRYFGSAAAVIAVFLFTFLPPVLAHAGLATTDMAVTAFLPAAFLAGQVWLEDPTTRHAVFFGVATALMVLSKFSALVFFPAAAGLALVVYLALERPPLASLAKEARRRIPSFGAAVLVACLVIWAGYRFSFGKVDFAGFSLPAPELYRGIQQVIEHNQSGHPGYLLGKRSDFGFWYFYPVVLATKTPIAFLLLLTAGVFFSIRKAERRSRLWIPLAFAAAILLAAAPSRINIGVRHVLPVYAAFSVIGAVAVVRLLEGGMGWRAGAMAAVAAAWLAGSSLYSHPDYLPYFNEFAGSEPERIAVDSDLDWGQDRKRLAARLREVGAREVSFISIGVADLEKEHGFPRLIENFELLRPNPGWNAVGLTVLKERRLGLNDTYPDVVLWPDRVPPLERVGKSIYLYYFPPQPAAPGR